MQNYTTKVHYERRENAITPILVRREFDTITKTWWVARVTELSFPLSANIEADNDWQAAVEAGDVTPITCNTRDALLLHPLGVLQTAQEYPRNEPYLAIDAWGLSVAALDWSENNGACDNPWVRELFAADPEENDDDSEV